ncbi:MAG: hypothetical protein ACRDT6_27315 [Micromonosporaceae bacterium]
MDDPLRELRTELGTPLPEGLDVFPAADAAQLATAVRDARARQRKALHAAVDEGLGLLPFLMRGTIKKILFG